MSRLGPNSRDHRPHFSEGREAKRRRSDGGDYFERDQDLASDRGSDRPFDRDLDYGRDRNYGRSPGGDLAHERDTALGRGFDEGPAPEYGSAYRTVEPGTYGRRESSCEVVDTFVLQNIDFGVSERDLREELLEHGVQFVDIVLHSGERKDGTLDGMGATVFIDSRDVQSIDTIVRLNHREFGPPGKSRVVLVIAVARRPLSSDDRDVRVGEREGERALGIGGPGADHVRDIDRETVGNGARVSAGDQSDLFVLQNLPFDLDARVIREELVGKGVDVVDVIMHGGGGDRKMNAGGANVFINRGDAKSVDNLLRLNRCEFGPPGRSRSLLVVRVDANREGEYTLCIAPPVGQTNISADRIKSLLPKGTVRDVRKVFRNDKLQFFVDMCTMRDFSEALLAPPKDRLFTIRAAPARGTDQARARMTMNGDGSGFDDRDDRNREPRDLLSPTRGGDLRANLSTRTIDPVRKPDYSPPRDNWGKGGDPEPMDPSHGGRRPLHGAGNGFESHAQRRSSPLPPPPPPRRGREFSPLRDLSPRREAPFSRMDTSPSRPRDSPGMQRWERSAREQVGGTSDVVIPRIVDDMREDARDVYVRLAEEMNDFCGNVLRDNPAFLVLNLPFLDDVNSKPERIVKEASLKTELESIYPDLQVVRVKILDVRGATAVVVVRSEEDCSTVLGPRSDRKFTLGDRLVRVTEFAEFTFLGKGYSRNPDRLSDLALLADSFGSRTDIRPSPKGEDFFVVRGGSFNLLLVLAMSGRFGRHGFKYVHTVDYSPPGSRPRLISPSNGQRAGSHEPAGARSYPPNGPREDRSDLGAGFNDKLLVKNIPEGMYPAALAKNLKSTLGLSDWIDTEPGPEPNSAVFLVKNSRTYDALLTQDGAFVRGFKGAGSQIDVMPFIPGDSGRENDRGSSPRGVDFSSTALKGVI